MAIETEPATSAPDTPRLQREPFRVFFPLAVVLGWVGISHWLLYALGASTTYSCLFHGLVQMQAFMMAFAVGFLLTALPRRTAGAPPSRLELVIAAAALVATTASALAEHWLLAELSYLALFLVLLQFAIRRFAGRSAGRRPPAAFVLIPLGAVHGVAGAALIAASTAPAAPVWMMGLGRLFVEQGVFLCFVVGIGSLVLPLMAGMPPPPDLGSSPREIRKALAYGAAGMMILTSLVLEQAGWARGGPILRAAIVTLGLGIGGGAWRMPTKPGLHRQLVWLSVWLIPAGVAASGLWPDYRVPALHVLFIGGFSLMAFGVATHVTFAHLGLEHLALGRPPAVAVLGLCLMLALMARVAADFSDGYFGHLGWAAGCWLAGSGVWLAFVGPKLLAR